MRPPCGARQRFSLRTDRDPDPLSRGAGQFFEPEIARRQPPAPASGSGACAMRSGNGRPDAPGAAIPGRLSITIGVDRVTWPPCARYRRAFRPCSPGRARAGEHRQRPIGKFARPHLRFDVEAPMAVRRSRQSRVLAARHADVPRRAILLDAQHALEHAHIGREGGPLGAAAKRALCADANASRRKRSPPPRPWPRRAAVPADAAVAAPRTCAPGAPALSAGTSAHSHPEPPQPPTGSTRHGAARHVHP